MHYTCLKHQIIKITPVVSSKNNPFQRSVFDMDYYSRPTTEKRKTALTCLLLYPVSIKDHQ